MTILKWTLVGGALFIAVLLAIAVLGLLQAYGEVLGRLNEMDRRLGAQPGRRLSSGFDPDVVRQGTTANDISGVAPNGDVLKVAVADRSHDSLIAFLSSGCLTCRTFWDELGNDSQQNVPRNARVVIVTKSPESETVADVVDLSPQGVPVVMSTETWEQYEVPGSPYFIYVDGPSGKIAGEGAAISWAQVLQLAERAMRDREGTNGTQSGSNSRIRRFLDPDDDERTMAELASAGIGPGHPSLHGGADEASKEKPT